MVRYPAPLKPGDRIGVTAPSSGVAPHLVPRFDACVASLRQQGYDVLVGQCLDGETHVSATKEERATERWAGAPEGRERGAEGTGLAKTCAGLVPRLGQNSKKGYFSNLKYFSYLVFKS